MKRQDGQALIEFILVFPVFVFLILAMLDFGSILYQKYRLENEIDYVTNLYQEGKENDIQVYASSKKIKVNIEKTESNVEITIAKDVKLSTPGLSNLMHSPYEVSVERVFYEK